MAGQPSENRSGPLPVTIFTGYLGAGKTTAINAVLRRSDGRRVMVLVNDFGEISLDESLIENRDGDLIALANGCMCCQIGGALYDAVDAVLKRRALIDHLVIETSGVADPAKIAQIAVAEPELELHQVIAFVDALNFSRQIDDPLLSDTLVRQIRAADRIFVTKIDLASARAADEANRKIALIDPGAPVTRLDSHKANEDLLLGRPAKPESGKQIAQPLSSHKVPFESWSWQGMQAVEKTRLMSFVANGELGAYRLKASLKLSDGTGIVVQKVGDVIETHAVLPTDTTGKIVAIGARGTFRKDAVETAWSEVLLQLRQA